jgi:hypothetical protein
MLLLFHERIAVRLMGCPLKERGYVGEETWWISNYKQF